MLDDFMENDKSLKTKHVEYDEKVKWYKELTGGATTEEDCKKIREIIDPSESQF